jgi:hypothetical protein
VNLVGRRVIGTRRQLLEDRPSLGRHADAVVTAEPLEVW